jgi:TolB-like protein
MGSWRIAALVVLSILVLSIPPWSEGRALAQGPGKTAALQLVSRHGKRSLEVAGRRATYYLVEPAAGMRLQAQGPVKLLVELRKDPAAQVRIGLELDGARLMEPRVDLRPETARVLYFALPEGEHLLLVDPEQAVLVRPLRVERGPRADELVVKASEADAAEAGSTPEADEQVPEPPAELLQGGEEAALVGRGEEAAPRLELEGAPRRVLVLELKAQGLPEAEVALVSARLTEVLGGVKGLEVVGAAEVAKLLEHEQDRQLLGCGEDAACMAQVSSVAASDWVVSGSVGSIGRVVLLSLSLVEVKSARVLGRVSETAEDLGGLEAALGGLVGRLLGVRQASDAPRFQLAEGQKLSIAVFDLVASGVTEEVAKSLTQVLSTELKRVEGARVISRDDIAAMLQLEQDKMLMGCKDDVRCVVEISGALGVDKLVVGQVGRLGPSFVVALKLVDPRSAQVDSRVTESFQGEEAQLIRAVRHAGRRLLGVGVEAKGALAVSASAEEAEVWVDEERQGELPLPPLGSLGVGRHAVRVAKRGFLDWRSEIYVDPEETTAVWAVLAERPARWYEQWWLWTVVGAVVVAGAVTAGVLLTQPEPSAGSGTVTFR